MLPARTSTRTPTPSDCSHCWAERRTGKQAENQFKMINFLKTTTRARFFSDVSEARDSSWILNLNPDSWTDRHACNGQMHANSVGNWKGDRQLKDFLPLDSVSRYLSPCTTTRCMMYYHVMSTFLLFIFFSRYKYPTVRVHRGVWMQNVGYSDKGFVANFSCDWWSVSWWCLL